MTGGEQGDDVAATRDPDMIQKEIEQTRAELADTIDAIAERISPKRAASRGAAAVKAQVSSAFGGGNGANGSAGARGVGGVRRGQRRQRLGAAQRARRRTGARVEGRHAGTSPGGPGDRP